MVQWWLMGALQWSLGVVTRPLEVSSGDQQLQMFYLTSDNQLLSHN